VKIIVHGPAAGPGPNGLIESWAPDQEVEVDDGDKKAVAWARAFAATPMATLAEDAAVRPPRPARPPVT
jgi:hypothetical protein